MLVVVVNDVMAKRYWKGADALGKRIRVTGDPQWSTIVGVVSGVIVGIGPRRIHSARPTTPSNPATEQLSNRLTA